MGVDNYIIIGYGSLLSPQSTSKTINTNAKIFQPIVINRYKRSFNVWARKSQYAALNVEFDEKHWLNGVLIYPINKFEIEELNKREGSYDLVRISKHLLFNKYRSNAVIPDYPIFTYTGKKQHLKNDIKTKKSYFDLCLEAALSYGGDFMKDYIETTFSSFGKEISKCSDEELFL